MGNRFIYSYNLRHIVHRNRQTRVKYILLCVRIYYVINSAVQTNNKRKDYSINYVGNTN